MPVWTDIVLRLSKAPYITIASIRGRTRGGGNELALALDLRYASRERAIFGQPEVGGGLLPGGGGTERLPRSIGRDRALEVILTSADYDAATPSDGAGSPGPCPTPNSTPSSTRSSLGWHPSTEPPSRGQEDGEPRVAATGRRPRDRLRRVRPLADPPGFLTRAAGARALSPTGRHRRRDRLGEYIGLANQQK